MNNEKEKGNPGDFFFLIKESPISIYSEIKTNNYHIRKNSQRKKNYNFITNLSST
jgi:hypothetical protein